MAKFTCLSPPPFQVSSPTTTRRAGEHLGTSSQSWIHPQEAKLWDERSTALTNHRNPAFLSCPAVLATALNYSLIVSFP